MVGGAAAAVRIRPGTVGAVSLFQEIGTADIVGDININMDGGQRIEQEPRVWQYTVFNL